MPRTSKKKEVKHDLNAMAKMQRSCDQFETYLSRRARQKFISDKPTRVRPHEWLKLTQDTWILTNDGSVNQYKAQVRKITPSFGGDPSMCYWQATIRTLALRSDGRQDFGESEEARKWCSDMVDELIRIGHNFQGPDVPVTTMLAEDVSIVSAIS